MEGLTSVGSFCVVIFAGRQGISMYGINDEFERGYAIRRNTENGIIFSEEMTKERYQREAECGNSGADTLAFVPYVRKKGKIDVALTQAKVKKLRDQYVARASGKSGKTRTGSRRRAMAKAS